MSLVISQRAGVIKAFFENPIFLSSVSACLFSQVVKTLVVLLRSRKRSPRDIVETLAWRTGGMPSSHSALVAALATSVALLEGIGSNLFVVTFFMALIILRDSLGVRRSSGIQARVLNMLGRNLAERFHIEYHPVKEVYGHTPLEVVVGALLGIFIAAAYAFL
jgi:acid phosphatase family membrane protein YuiD